MLFVVNVLYIENINPIYVKQKFSKKNTKKKTFVRTNFLIEQTKRIFLVFFLNMMMKITMMMMMMGWCTNNLMMIWWCKWLVNGMSVLRRINCELHNGDYEFWKSGIDVVPTRDLLLDNMLMWEQLLIAWISAGYFWILTHKMCFFFFFSFFFVSFLSFKLHTLSTHTHLMYSSV